MKNGYLVISLDFELMWGIFDVIDGKVKQNYFRNTRESIPQVLELFEEYDINATWAVVGMLLNKDWNEWSQNFPSELPNYNNSSLSAYKFGISVKGTAEEEMFFAPELVTSISRTKGQEIGTHTYSHYYCLEKGQNSDHFRLDLEKSIELANHHGFSIKSLVFPRNQLRREYLEICNKYGIETVRSNPSSWYWRDTTSEALLNKAARSGDAYLPFGKKSYSFDQLEQHKNFPLEQKASRFLRPVEKNKTLRRMKLRRIKQEIGEAAVKKEVYHLWWHPHNFGDNPTEGLRDLREILEHYKECNLRYQFRSVTMHQLSQLTRSY